MFMISARAQDARYFRVSGPVATSITAVSTDGYITWTNAATNSTFIVQTIGTLLNPSNWVDYVQVPATNSLTTLRIFDLNPPSGMALIPAGSFLMGNCKETNEGQPSELPLHTVYVSAFYMDQHLVTQTLWNGVFQWATNHGYSFNQSVSAKAANHPVQGIGWWYDMVKWCNARSEMEGLTPAYYADAEQTVVYRVGTNELSADMVNWNAGYRLPTEAEWEKAARGGLNGQRFPWGNTISGSQANYSSSYGLGNPQTVYDLGPTNGYNPIFNDGLQPYTSPVGYFAPNGYGLYDMAGNVFEQCWDWASASWYSNPLAVQSDTRGPSGPLNFRLLRSGNWASFSSVSRCASRILSNPPFASFDSGFRCVRGL